MKGKWCQIFVPFPFLKSCLLRHILCHGHDNERQLNCCVSLSHKIICWQKIWFSACSSCQFLCEKAFYARWKQMLFFGNLAVQFQWHINKAIYIIFSTEMSDAQSWFSLNYQTAPNFSANYYVQLIRYHYTRKERHKRKIVVKIRMCFADQQW